MPTLLVLRLLAECDVRATFFILGWVINLYPHLFATQVRECLWEFPASTVSIGKRNWPVDGDGNFRLFPLWVTRQAARRINAEGHPAAVFLHPSEVDPGQPRIPNTPLLSRFRHYVNSHKTEIRLQRLLSEFQFAPMCRVMDSYLRWQIK